MAAAAPTPAVMDVSVELLYAGNTSAVRGLAGAAVLRGWSGAGSDASERVQLGEGAIWDHRTATLFWIDILGKRLHALHTRESDDARRHRRWPLSSRPGTVVLTSDAHVVLVACEDGLQYVDVDSGRVAHSGLVPDKGMHNHRCNDGKTDPSGRLVVGTMDMDESEAGRGKGSLYRLGADGVLERLAGGVSVPNGLAWSADGARFWHTDVRRTSHTAAAAASAADCD